jgi:hypothetical protein
MMLHFLFTIGLILIMKSFSWLFLTLFTLVAHPVYAQGSALVPSDIFFSDSSSGKTTDSSQSINAITQPVLKLDDATLQKIVLTHHLTGHRFIAFPAVAHGKEVDIAMIKKYLPDSWNNIAHFHVIDWQHRFETFSDEPNTIHIHLSRHGYINRINLN